MDGAGSPPAQRPATVRPVSGSPWSVPGSDDSWWRGRPAEGFGRHAAPSEPAPDPAGVGRTEDQGPAVGWPQASWEQAPWRKAAAGHADYAAAGQSVADGLQADQTPAGLDRTVAPGTGEPGTVQPGTGEPSTGEPSTVPPSTVRPGTGEPAAVEPAATEPGTARPGTGEPGTVRPGTVNPGTVEPGTVQPGTGESGTVESGTVESGTGESGTVESGTGESSAVEPAATGERAQPDRAAAGRRGPARTGSSRAETRVYSAHSHATAGETTRVDPAEAEPATEAEATRAETTRVDATQTESVQAETAGSENAATAAPDWPELQPAPTGAVPTAQQGRAADRHRLEDDPAETVVLDRRGELSDRDDSDQAEVEQADTDEAEARWLSRAALVDAVPDAGSDPVLLPERGSRRSAAQRAVPEPSRPVFAGPRRAPAPTARSEGPPFWLPSREEPHESGGPEPANWPVPQMRSAHGWTLAPAGPGTKGRRAPVPKPPRRPAVGLAALVLLALAGAFFAWVSAEPLWLAVGHGERGTATVTRCIGSGMSQRCVGRFVAAGEKFRADDVALLGVDGARQPGATLDARMVGSKSRQAYVSGAGTVMHLRWVVGVLLVVLCGFGIALATGARRLEHRRGRRFAIVASVGAPLLLLVGFLAASY